MSVNSFPQTPLRHSSDLLFREVNGRVQVCHLARAADALFEIDGLAALLWLSINGQRSANELIELILTKVAPQQHARCRADCEVFLQELIEKGLVLI